MRIAVVTDAWTPQRNGVVTVLVDLRARLRSSRRCISGEAPHASSISR